MVTAILDTNVFIRAALRPGSPSARVVDAYLDGTFQLILSQTVLQELLTVLHEAATTCPSSAIFNSGPACYTERQLREGIAMSAPTVPISHASHQLLKELAAHTGQTTMDVLDKALETYRRKVFFEELNAGYAELRADPDAWGLHLAERKLWDATLMDGLDPDERWTEDGRCVMPEEGKP